MISGRLALPPKDSWWALCVLMCLAGCEAYRPPRPSAVTSNIPILSTDIQRAFGRTWLGTTQRADKVFGCLHGRVVTTSVGATAVEVSEMQLAYIDGGDCYGPDAVGILAFAGPKPDDVVKYYLGVVRAQQGLLCPRRDWLIVGIAYDTTDSKLRTSWVARTTASNADCSDSTKLLNAEQVNFSLPR